MRAIEAADEGTGSPESSKKRRYVGTVERETMRATVREIPKRTSPRNSDVNADRWKRRGGSP